MPHFKLRRLRFCALLFCAVLTASCGGGSSNEDLASAPSGLCRWLTSELPDGECVAVAPWTSLAAWRTDQPQVDLSWLGLGSSGTDPVEAAALQSQLGFLAPGRSDLPRWPLVAPLNWNADPFHDSNWRFQLDAWRMLDPLILAWHQTGQAAYMGEALRIVDDWYLYHIEQGRSSAYGWGDMATGLRAMKLAWFLDTALREAFILDAAQREHLLELAQRHVHALQQEDFLAEGNHGLFQMHGLLALCMTVPYLDGCSSGVNYAKGAMQRLLRLQFTDEGVHREHSPAYHLFVADTLKRMLRPGWYDGFAFVQSLLPRVEANRVWMYHPDGKLVTVGDSEAEGTPIRFPAGKAGCEAANEVQARCYMLQAFPETGYAIARSDWAVPVGASSMLFLMASFHSPAHKHADDLSFELFEFGERLLTDTGQYKYANDPWRDFAVSTRAHNTLEIDGGSSIAQGNAYGSGLRTASLEDGRYVFVAEASQADSGRTHRRRLYYTPRRLLLVVDEVKGPPPVSAIQWFHFAPQVQVAAIAEVPGRFVATLGAGREVHVEQLQPGCAAILDRGSSKPFIQGWTTQSYGVLVPRFTLGFECARAAPAYVTLFVLDPAQDAAVRQEAAVILRSLGLPGSNDF